jgi:hypothetical protein
MYEVQNGKRLIRFDGALLAFSSSFREGSPRWVEFNLYRTTGGAYVLSRVGQTKVYHVYGCDVVSRNRPPKTTIHAVSEGSVPCNQCHPPSVNASSDVEVYVEMPRYWATISESPTGVVDALYKYNEAGARYLTKVAEQLLEEAAARDINIANAYQVEDVF